MKIIKKSQQGVPPSSQAVLLNQKGNLPFAPGGNSNIPPQTGISQTQSLTRLLPRSGNPINKRSIYPLINELRKQTGVLSSGLSQMSDIEILSQVDLISDVINRVVQTIQRGSKQTTVNKPQSIENLKLLNKQDKVFGENR